MQSGRLAQQLSRAHPACRQHLTWRAPAARAASTASTAPPTSPWCVAHNKNHGCHRQMRLLLSSRPLPGHCLSTLCSR
jgi:hypothetical protein